MESEGENDIQEMYTCGVCEEIVENVEAVCNHSCLEGYPKMMLDKNRYFYPQCDNGDIVRRSDVNGKNVNVVESSQLSSNIPQSISESNTDEILIAEVHLREPLWNQNVAIVRRDRRTIDKLWQEVSEATKGVYSAETAKTKWKNFRDRFMRIVGAEKLPSGAASQPKKKWRFYESLNFLRDTLLIKKTVSNTAVANDVENIENEEIPVDEEEESSHISKNSKKRKGSKTTEDSILAQINESLREPPQTISLPPPPVMDEIDHWGMMICLQLRQLSETRRRQLMFKIHKMLYEENN